MTAEAKICAAVNAYFNAAIQKIGTESSVLVSSSKYLNHQELRHLVSQEMLRRNGADMPNTAFIPEVAQILMMLEDFPRIIALFEEEKARLPQFKKWCDTRSLSDFKKAFEDVRSWPDVDDLRIVTADAEGEGEVYAQAIVIVTNASVDRFVERLGRLGGCDVVVADENVRRKLRVSGQTQAWVVRWP